MIYKYGITVNYRRLMRDLSVRLNHGRKRKKVSVRNPSPQISRKELRLQKQIALINDVMKKGL